MKGGDLKILLKSNLRQPTPPVNSPRRSISGVKNPNHEIHLGKIIIPNVPRDGVKSTSHFGILSPDSSDVMVKEL